MGNSFAFHWGWPGGHGFWGGLLYMANALSGSPSFGFFLLQLSWALFLRCRFFWLPPTQLSLPLLPNLLHVPPLFLPRLYPPFTHISAPQPLVSVPWIVRLISSWLAFSWKKHPCPYFIPPTVTSPAVPPLLLIYPRQTLEEETFDGWSIILLAGDGGVLGGGVLRFSTSSPCMVESSVGSSRKVRLDKDPACAFFLVAFLVSPPLVLTILSENSWWGWFSEMVWESVGEWAVEEALWWFIFQTWVGFLNVGERGETVYGEWELILQRGVIIM